MAAPHTIQLNICKGVSSEDGPYARVVRVPGGGDDEYLLMVAEARGPEGDEVCDNALDYLARAFAAGNLSVSRRMLDGLKGIHVGLANDNRTSLPSQRVTLGVVLAYARGEDVYLAQAGHATAHLVDQDGCHLLTGARDGDLEELGGARSPQLVVRRLRVQQEQRLVLLAGRVADNAWDDTVTAAFQDGLDEGMVAIYRRDSRAEALGALGYELPGSRSRSRRPATNEIPAVRYGGSLRTKPQAATPDTDFAYVPAPMETPGRRLSVSLRPQSIRVANPLAGLIPARVYIGAAVVFIVLGLALGITSIAESMGQQAQQQTQQQLQAAADQERRAGEADTTDRRRELLTQAGQAYEAILQRSANQPDARIGADRVRQSLTDLDAIVRLNDLRVLTEVGAAAGSTVLIREVLSTPAGLMLLDKGGDRVMQVASLAQQGGGSQPEASVYSQSPTRGRRNLAHLVWMGKAASWPRDSLLALDDNRQLMELPATGDPRPLTLRGSSDWESMQSAEGYNGVLYVLDPKASQVWRYAPTDDGFDSERRPALPSLDLRDGVDMAIDGDFYVLLRTGRVLKVSGNRAVPFSLDGLDKPLLNPVAVTTSADLTALYVLDQGNRRVVAFDKQSGRFLHQYPLPDVPVAHDLWVDGARNALYLVTDRQLYTATMPRG